MAFLAAPVGIGRPYDTAGLIRNGVYSIYSATDSASGAHYIHMKTNYTLNTYVMCMIEAVGYKLYSTAPIRCAWNFYAYSYLIHNVVTSLYTGMSAVAVYVAADGYLVLQAYSDETRGLGFVLNTYNTAGAGIGANLLITESAITANAGAYY